MLGQVFGQELYQERDFPDKHTIVPEVLAGRQVRLGGIPIWLFTETLHGMEGYPDHDRILSGESYLEMESHQSKEAVYCD